jgi:PmbA protein
MDFNQQVDSVMSAVLDAGATGDLILNQNSAVSLGAKDGQLDEHKVSSSQIFGLRVIKDNKVGTAYSEASDEQALSTMVEQALINASYGLEDEHESILPNSGSIDSDDALLCPPDEVGLDEKIDALLTLEANLHKKDLVKNVPYNGYQEQQAEHRLFTSSGLSARSKDGSSLLYAYALLDDGTNNSMQGSGQASRLFKHLNPSTLVDTVYENSFGILAGKPVKTGHFDVIFSEECQPEVFGVFSAMFSGKSAKDGINPMRDKVGEVMADPRLNISDQPLLSEGLAYQLFDAEGSLTATTPLIVDGCLQSLIHNSASASYYGLKTTAHASRSPKSSLGVALQQLTIAAGETSESSLRAGEYLELVDLSGTHSGANTLSGDFSFGASGYLCRDGKRIQAVRGITVAGNFYQMLLKIAAIGDTQFWNWERSALMPAIRFADVAIAGE